MSQASTSILPIDAQQFSLRFRLLMSYHDMTLRDIAECTNNAVSTVGTWKNGRVPTSADTLERLAGAFGVTVDFLLYGQTGGRNFTQSDAASRMLDDLESLMAEVEAPADVREPQETYRRQQQACDQTGDSPGIFWRSRIENYVGEFLDRAQEQPGGLAHTWYHLRREFPLDLFARLG